MAKQAKNYKSFFKIVVQKNNLGTVADLKGATKV